jgi:outer membrane murein-binding lipoprotein Lpp
LEPLLNEVAPQAARLAPPARLEAHVDGLETLRVGEAATGSKLRDGQHTDSNRNAKIPAQRQKMRKAAEEWTDGRLDELASALDPLPAQVAVLSTAVDYLRDLGTNLDPLRAQVAVLSASVERLSDDNRVLREEIVALNRQLTQIGWGLVAAMLGAATALIVALL